MTRRALGEIMHRLFGVPADARAQERAKPISDDERRAVEGELDEVRQELARAQSRALQVRMQAERQLAE